MATAPTFTATGNSSTQKATLPKEIFGVESVSHDLIHQAYVVQQSNQRVHSAHAKTRGEVRGGGRKPRPQKYTGRARAGSIRSPIWRGGGITFGPAGDKSRRKHLNKTARRAALKQALSLRASEGAVAVIEDIKADGTTKSARKIVDALPLKGGLLYVADSLNLEVKRSMRNLPDVHTTDAASLNVVDVMEADNVVLTRSGLQTLQQRLGGKT